MQDAGALEQEQIHEKHVFIIKSNHTKNAAPSGFKKIIFHVIFDVMYDERHKSRLVATLETTLLNPFAQE